MQRADSEEVGACSHSRSALNGRSDSPWVEVGLGRKLVGGLGALGNIHYIIEAGQENRA